MGCRVWESGCRVSRESRFIHWSFTVCHFAKSQPAINMMVLTTNVKIAILSAVASFFGFLRASVPSEATS